MFRGIDHPGKVEHQVDEGVLAVVSRVRGVALMTNVMITYGI
jgi:hypothetical protein